MNVPYTALMGLSITTAIVLARRRQRRLSLTATERVGIALGAFCGAMIAAKLPFVFTDWDGLRSGAAWLDNGKTIVLGLAGGYLGVEIAKWSLDIHVRTGDTFAVPVAAAVAIGRLACFVGGCCYGTPTTLPWGVNFIGDGPRHPTQLYEAAFHATAACLLLWCERRGLFRGQLIKLYILAYAGFRFLTEFIRPEVRLWLGLTGYQWAVLAMVPIYAWLWRRDARAMAREAVALQP